MHEFLLAHAGKIFITWRKNVAESPYSARRSTAEQQSAAHQVRVRSVVAPQARSRGTLFEAYRTVPYQTQLDLLLSGKTAKEISKPSLDIYLKRL